MAGADVRTVLRLAFRHLVVDRGRALILLLGYAIGAAVMMVLLSVGEAMLVQSRDVRLVGGGQVIILPEGIDLEGLRTGSIGSMFFGIDHARFLVRRIVGGERQADVVAATAPLIEHKLLYLVRGHDLVPIRAGGEIPSRSAAVGAPLGVASGSWVDSPEDRRYFHPTAGELYDELDRFHRPADDSTWAEWHYFNLAPSADEWWYLTYLTGGRWAAGAGGGQLLVTRHRGSRPVARFSAGASAADVHFDTTRADLAIGPHTVTQRDGRYRILGAALGPTGRVRFDLTVTPEPAAYFPPVEIKRDSFVSGYVAPAVRALAAGTICENGRCREIHDAPAYHDHNWGVWRETIWDWGQGRGTGLTVLYGGVLAPDAPERSTGSPYFLVAVDSAGVRQVLRFRRIDYRGAQPVDGAPGLRAPRSFTIAAGRDADTLAVRVDVARVQATSTGTPGSGRAFLQMRGTFRLSGRLLGRAVSDSGLGFFETFVSTSPANRPAVRPDTPGSASSPRSARRAEARGEPGSRPTGDR